MMKRVLNTLPLCILLFIIYVRSKRLAHHLDSLIPSKSFTSQIDYFEEDYKNTAEDLQVHRGLIRRYFNQRNNWTTSNLGAILFKRVKPNIFTPVKNKIFIILTWKWSIWRNFNERFFLNTTTSGFSNDSFNGCSVNNCLVTHEDDQFNAADAVIIHMHKSLIPDVKERNLNQRWIFFSEESPFNSFGLEADEELLFEDFANIFNWTMTYRSDSDIPVPFGRTVPLAEPQNVNMSDTKRALSLLVPSWEKKYANRAIVILRNCEPSKLQIILGIRQHIEVDIYGECSNRPDDKIKCSSDIFTDCILPSYYYFYLVLEDSRCRQYISEKAFHYAYSKGAIPVLIAPSLEDCNKLLPPKSFLHIDSYKSVNELGKRMGEIAKQRRKFLEYQAWRRHFNVVNEHGYFRTKSHHLCRVCEALNYNDHGVKTYDEDDVALFLDKKILCDTVKVTVKSNHSDGKP